MQTLFDQDFDNMELLEGALELNQAVDPTIDVSKCKEDIHTLLFAAEDVLAHYIDQQQRFDAFVTLFYQQWGFKGDHETYFDHQNGFIDKVLARRKGIPVSLGCIFLYIGRQLGFPLEAVNFPSQFVMKLVWPEQAARYINPFNGEYVKEKTLQAWLIGHSGPFAQLSSKHLKTADNSTVIGRWLALHKGALIREENFELALRCSSLALSVVPDDPYEIRDRGFIYQQLHCNQIAAADFQYFIDQCPDDPAAELLKLQVKQLTNATTVMH